ncbi:MAG TPA: BTAD domain-containing putative transcriptional regulator, partial [Actinomycetota bacterium]|nr:BTAD domain-containing putative transcriptional regulator [Actinomycetota bacterium]
MAAREHGRVIELRVLGPVEVLRNGQMVRIPGDRERALLALVVIERGGVLSTDQLIDRLWGDHLPDNPSNALQAVVSRLRRAIGNEAIVTKKPGYALGIELDAIDASRFEDLLERATAVGLEEPARTSRLLAEALSLWRGPAYADLAYEDLARDERSRLEELRIAAMEEKVAADLALGRNREALMELERLIVDHPLRERLRAQLMLALYRAGRQSDAVAAYQETRRVLAEELGLDPGPELENTYQLILRQDPSLQAPAITDGGFKRTNIPTRVTSFVGREPEIQELTKLVRDNRLVTVIGPGGAGKTSLATEVARGLLESFDRG